MAKKTKTKTKTKKKKKSLSAGRTKLVGDMQYAKAVRYYLAGDSRRASEAVEATLLCNSTHRKAKELQKRLIDADHPMEVSTKDGRTILKDGDGHFMPGQSANPAGRPVGSGNKISITKLIEAIKEVESGVEGEATKTELLIHLVQRAYKSDTVLLGLFKKLLPDLKVVEGLIATAAYDMPEEEAVAIQETLRQRYENAKS